MLYVCGVSLCWLPRLPLYLETVEGGGGILCAYSCMLLEGCKEDFAGFVVCGAHPHLDAWDCVQHFAGMPPFFEAGAKHSFPPPSHLFLRLGTPLVVHALCSAVYVLYVLYMYPRGRCFRPPLCVVRVPVYSRDISSRSCEV